MKKRVLLIVAVSLFVVSPVLAADGNEILKRCNEAVKAQEKNYRETDKQDEVGYCLGLISGVMSEHLVLEKYRNQPRMFCIPEKTETIEIMKKFVKYLETNPKILKHNDTLLLIKALKEAYPCPKRLKPIK